MEVIFVFVILLNCPHMSGSHQAPHLGLSRGGSPVMPCLFTVHFKDSC